MRERIQRLSRARGKNTVVVAVGDRQYEIAGSAADELGLSPGLAVTEALRARIEAAAERRAAAALALAWLRRRPQTEFELRRHLEDAGFAPATVEGVLEELQRRALVDDARFARWFVAARLHRRPSGAAALVEEMCARGVAREVAEVAARRGTEAGEAELAVAAARRRLASLRGLPKHQAAGRLARFLAARGFDEDTVREACETLLGPPGGRGGA